MRPARKDSSVVTNGHQVQPEPLCGQRVPERGVGRIPQPVDIRMLPEPVGPDQESCLPAITENGRW